jgi:hypothetical protein
VPLCCSRAQHDDGKFRTASDYVSLHPHARAAGTPTGRSPFPDASFPRTNPADERVPTTLCRGNNVARPYQPSGLFRRAPRSLDTSGQSFHAQHLLPTVLPNGHSDRSRPTLFPPRSSTNESACAVEESLFDPSSKPSGVILHKSGSTY